MSPEDAAKQIGALVSQILNLAPHAGLHIGIKIERADGRQRAEVKQAIAADGHLSLRECARKHGVGVSVVRSVRKASAGEAGTAETAQTGSVHEHAAPEEGDAHV